MEQKEQTQIPIQILSKAVISIHIDFLANDQVHFIGRCIGISPELAKIILRGYSERILDEEILKKKVEAAIKDKMAAIGDE